MGKEEQEAQEMARQCQAEELRKLKQEELRRHEEERKEMERRVREEQERQQAELRRREAERKRLQLEQEMRDREEQLALQKQHGQERQLEEKRLEEKARKELQQEQDQKKIRAWLQANGFKGINDLVRKKFSKVAPLQYAIQQNDADMLTLLLQNGADVSKVNGKNESALTVAQKMDKKGSHAAVVQALMTHAK